RGDEMAFGVPGHTEDNTMVAAEPHVTAELDAHPVGLRVPDLREPVGAGRNNPPAVGTERHAADFMAVSSEGQGFLALVPPERRRIPDADGLILAGRGEAPAVRAERHAAAPVCVSAQGEHLPAGRRVPDAHRLVFAARSKAPAVRVAERDALDVSSMQVERS